MGIGIRPVADDAVGVVGPFVETEPSLSGLIRSGFLFEIGTTPLRLASVHGYWNQYDMNEYQARIISDSFSGVTMRLELESKLFAPSEITFSVENADGTYAESDFADKEVIVRELVNADVDEEDLDTGVRSWKFFITHAQGAYGKIEVKAISLMQKYITGYYPRTPLVTSLFTGDMKPADESACVPKIFNSAYIPVAPGAYDNGGGDEWFYIIASGAWNSSNYTFDRVFSPPEVNNASWPETTYDFNGYTLTGEDNKNYVGMQFLIQDSDDDGDADANGVWVSNAGALSPLLWYGQANQQYVGAGPAEVLYYVMTDMGISAWHLDWNDEWQQIDVDIASVTTDSTEMRFGLFRKEPFENFLSDYLRCFDMYLSFGEKINLHQFSADPVETFDIDNILELSYSSSFHEKDNVNGGTVAFVRYLDDPDHIMGGQVIVPLSTTQTEDVTDPAGDVFKFRFRMEDAGIPYVFGLLYFQKLYDIKHRASFSASAGDITNWETLRPGQVVTIAGDSAYGEEQSLVITELQFNSDLSISISGNVYNHLEDWSDVTPTTNTVYAPSDTYTIETYTVEKINGATSDIQLTGNYIKFPTGQLWAPEHDCFQVTMSGDQSNITEGEDVYVAFDTVTNETPADVFTVDDETPAYYYTANGDGWRQFNVNIRFKQVDVGTTEISVMLITSNETFYFAEDGRNVAVDAYPSAAFSQLAWLDDNDTAKVKINITGGAEQVDIQSISQFSGFYVNTKV